jgi:alpha-L-fucosidase 2
LSDTLAGRLGAAIITVLWLAILSAAWAGASAAGGSMERYNVVWNTPSKDSSGSMPLGNGDIGLSVWVEEGGDLLFYIGKTDAWSGNARLLKLGRVRVRFTPNPFAKGMPFVQTLRLEHADIAIRAGEGSHAVSLRIWVDANAPVIRIEATGHMKFDAQVTLELWRTKERTLSDGEMFSAYGMDGGPQPVTVTRDTVLAAQGDRIVWFHRNEASIWPLTLKLQGMEGWARRAMDPLLHRTFGGIIKSDDLINADAATLTSPQPQRRYVVSCCILTAQTATAEQWVRRAEQLIRRVEAQDLETARAAHANWWRDFWNRSWIRVSGAPDADTVTRGYVLQRFISACAGRGAYPVKFNGSIFTVDAREPNENFDADYRRWGGPYWFQNTRLIYWPKLAAGDFEMMQALFRMYLDALPFAKERTRLYFGHGGAFLPETMYFWGSYANSNYGWNREGKSVSRVDNTFIRWYYSGALELLAIALDYHAFTRDREFARRTLLPLADAILTFYDEHYPRNGQGRMLLKPAQSLETWPSVINPLPDIAGLRFVLQGLNALPSDLVARRQREQWSRLLRELPAIPTRVTDGQTLLAPAADILAPNQNSENPELYAIFPYRLYGVGKPALEMARATFAARRFKGNAGWQQDDTQAAFLGLAAEARQRVASRFASANPGSRFPAFWGPNFDWIPDQDHGCNGLMALQTMLLQCDSQRILLFPGWPKEWDVEFKLHAPANTTVEGVYRAGKLERLSVTPIERVDDVTVFEPQ